MKAMSPGLTRVSIEQFLAERDDFHDLLAGLDEAADGGHLDVVDDAVDRRTQLQPAERAAAAERLLVDGDLLLDLAALR